MVELVEDGAILDPDTLKMPESPEHRRMVELVAAAAERALGPGWVCYRDMNWYPTDGGGPIAPDAQVLPAGTLPKGAKSYRQAELAGPRPHVAVEVPSDADSITSFRRKLTRYRRLGVPVYVAHVDEVSPAAERLAPDQEVGAPWLDRPCPELGGIELTIVDGALGVRTHDRFEVRSISELQAAIEARAAEAEAQAAEAESELERLREQLRRHGLQPRGQGGGHG